MDRLISDLFVRRTAQAILVAVLGGLILLCFIVTTFVHLATVGRLDNLDPAIKIFAFIASPLQQTFSGLLALFTVIIPVVFSQVCYEVNTEVSPPAPGERLNHVGHAAFLLTVIGVVAGAGALVIFTFDGLALNSLSATPERAAAVQGLINGIIAFNGVYFAQLLGLKPK